MLTAIYILGMIFAGWGFSPLIILALVFIDITIGWSI